MRLGKISKIRRFPPPRCVKKLSAKMAESCSFMVPLIEPSCIMTASTYEHNPCSHICWRPNPSVLPRMNRNSRNIIPLLYHRPKIIDRQHCSHSLEPLEVGRLNSEVVKEGAGSRIAHLYGCSHVLQPRQRKEPYETEASSTRSVYDERSGGRWKGNKEDRGRHYRQ